MPASAWLLPALAAASALGTWMTLRYARQRRLLDQPGERRSHAVPTPRGGGLGIALVLLPMALLAAAMGWTSWQQSGAFAVGLALVAGIGWWDDHHPLSPWWRLAVQVLAGVVLALGLFGFDGRWGWALLSLAAVPVLVNVWNFMDGINGLATSQALLAAVTLALLAPSAAGPAGWALAAACCGFLPFNFPRARIFLGDVGSGTLGYALATVALLAAPEVSTGGWGRGLVVLLPLSAFLVDASLTLAWRMLAREQWWLPHVSHLYQRWVRAGRTHVFVTAVYALFSFVDGILALVLNQSAPWLAGGSTVAWLLLATCLWFMLRRTTSTDRNGLGG